MNEWSVEEAADLAKLWGLSGRIERLAGERDCNFRVDMDGTSWVLKITHPDEDPSVAEFQTAALQHVADRAPDLPIPEVRKTSDGRLFHHLAQAPDGKPRLVRVVSWLDGRPMASGALDDAAQQQLGGLMAQLDLALADFSHPAQNHELVWDLSRAHHLRDRLQHISNPQLQALAGAALDGHAQDFGPRAQKLRRQVIHNDMNPHNILLSPAGDSLTGVIDFGDMVSAPLINELGVALSYQMCAEGHPLAGAARIAAAYHSVLPLLTEELRILPGLMAARMATTVTTSHWMTAEQPENRDYLLRNMTRAAAGLAAMAQLGTAQAGNYFIETIHMAGAVK